MNYDDDLPDDAFTDLEREAGLDFICGTAIRQPRHATSEIKPTIDRAHLEALLVQGICEFPLNVYMVLDPPHPYAQAYLQSFAGRPDRPLPGVYLSIERDYDVPFSFLVDVLRATGLPFISDEGELVWDDQEKLIDSPPGRFDLQWQFEAALKADALDQVDEHLMHVIRRAALSTDHGKKPILLHRNFVAEALQCMEFPFEQPRIIHCRDFGDYMVAFYDSLGKPRIVPLSQLASLKLPIFTRACAYSVGQDGLYPFMNTAKLLISAFRIAVKHNPNEFEWYLARQSGTVFDSVIERIEAPRDPLARPIDPRDLDRPEDPHRRMFEAQYDCDAANNAMALVALSAELEGTTYVTLGGPPFDADLVTTPRLYHHAVATLSSSGYHPRYDTTPGAKLTVIPR